jgi:hypothetical protein
MIRLFKTLCLKQKFPIYKLTKMESNKIETRNLFQYVHLKPMIIYKDIHLTDWEKEIFEIIKSVLHKNNKTTVCRVAGGWVRDKVNLSVTIDARERQ